MSNLYSLTQEAKELYKQLTDVDDETGELLNPDIFDLIVKNNAEIEAKADGYAAIKKMLDGEISLLDTEIKRLQAIKAQRVNSKDRLMKSLQDAMVVLQRAEIVSPLNKFKICKNGGKAKLTIDDGVEIPQEYMKIIYEADTEKIRNDLEQGIEIIGCKIEERGTHLRIS